MSIDQSQLMRDMRSTIEQVMPGAVRPGPMTVGPDGFGIRCGSGAGLVLVTADQDEPYFFNITGGLATNVEDIYGAMNWVNSKNSGNRFGRYYVSIPAEGQPRCNVVYQANVFSMMMPDQRDWCAQMMRLVVETVDNEALPLQQSVGGSLFEDSPDTLIVLMAASFG